MLELFRRYQKVLFLVVTVMVVFSFVFFGTYSTFGDAEERVDHQIGKIIDGSTMRLSEVQNLSRFIATDREDTWQKRGVAPNLCNDGVIRYDFIKDGLAYLLVTDYFDALKGDFEARLDKAKRYKPYAHPEAPFLSAKVVWDHFLPELNANIAALQSEKEVNLGVFTHLEKLYQCQSRLQPEMLRQILMYQHRQYPGLAVDQRLSYEDMALFGFHSASDWFGHNFIDLISEFILNAANVAVAKGYQVTLQEAKGDLIHRFQEAVDHLKKNHQEGELNFHGHLRMLGFDEKSASEVWRKVLLFRRYFQDVGEAAFVDQLPYRGFAGYAHETAMVQAYRWPITLSSSLDAAALQYYIKAISSQQKNGLPVALLPTTEVEKKNPELVQKTVKAKVAEVSKKQVGLRPSVRQVWDWEIENWDLIAKQFSLPKVEGREAKFKALEKESKRAEIDAWARLKMVDENPSWVEEALAVAPFNEKTWNVMGDKEPLLQNEGIYYRLQDLEVVKDKHILTFNEAKEILSKLAPKVESDFDKEKTLFAKVSKDAMNALQKDGNDSRWIQTGEDPLLDQFRLEKREQAIQRTSKEDWMKEQAFTMLPELWSPIHVAGNGEIVFFYLQEKTTQSAPILDQLLFGKETLAADAKLYASEALLKEIKQKNAIVIPAHKETE